MIDPTPVWQRLLAAVYLAVVVALIVGFSGRIGPDFWPADRSYVGPNILAEVVTILVATPVGVLVWPPTRRRIHRFMDRKLAAHHEALHARHDQLAQSHDELHAKLDRILSHIESQGDAQ